MIFTKSCRSSTTTEESLSSIDVSSPFRYVGRPDQFDPETIFMTADELLRFLRDEQKVAERKPIVETTEKSGGNFL